jgi:hypothetical protein
MGGHGVQRWGVSEVKGLFDFLHLEAVRDSYIHTF